MYKFLIGTQSNIKLEAIEKFLQEQKGLKYSILGFDVNSGVPGTPYNSETKLGAKNRAENLRVAVKEIANEDFLVGIESGILTENDGVLFENCSCCIIYHGQYYYGYSSAFMLPNEMSKLMKNGTKHEELMKELDNKAGVKIKDTWYHYSHSQLSRSHSFYEAFRNAFLSIKLT